MAKTRRDKFDLFTLAIKQQLIGTSIVMDNDDILEVADFYIDFPTSEIHIEFTDSSEGSFSLQEKYVVEIEDTYKSVTSKKKNKKGKRNT